MRRAPRSVRSRGLPLVMRGTARHGWEDVNTVILKKTRPRDPTMLRCLWKSAGRPAARRCRPASSPAASGRSSKPPCAWWPPRGRATVRLRDVARASGVSVGSLQYYFDSRDQLIREAFDQHARESWNWSRWRATRRRRRGPGSRPSSRRPCSAPTCASRPRCGWSSSPPGLHDDQLRALLAGAYEAWRELLAEVVRAGTETGDFRPLLPAADRGGVPGRAHRRLRARGRDRRGRRDPGRHRREDQGRGDGPARPATGRAVPLVWPGGHAEQGHDPVHLAGGAAVQHRDPIPQLPVRGARA